MTLSVFLAWRFLFSRHRSGFVRLLTYLSISSVGLALAAFVIVLSVMNGFDRDLRGRIISGIGAIRGFPVSGELAYDSTVERLILETPGVTASTPEIHFPALVRGRGVAVSEIQVTASSMDSKIKTSPILRQLSEGSRLPGAGEILLGSEVASRLSVSAGETVAVLSPDGSGLGNPVSYRVSGVYRTGYYEVDATSAVLSIDPRRASPMLAHEIEIAVVRPEDAPHVASQLTDRLSKSDLYFRSWKEMREPLFRAVSLEKRVMAVILSLFGVVAVFSVLSAVTSTAVEKRRDLATLRAMGMTRAKLASVLFSAGAIAGGLGVILGGVLSVAGHVFILRSDLFRLPSDVYDLDHLPSEWSTPFFLVTAAVLFFCSVLSAFIPAWVQSRKSASEALREE